MSMILYLSAILNCSPVLSVYCVYRVPKRAEKGTVYTGAFCGLLGTRFPPDTLKTGVQVGVAA